MAPKPKETEVEDEPKAASGPSMMQLVIALVVLTVLGIGGGTLLGASMVGVVETAIKARPEPPEPEGEPAYSEHARIIPLMPVIANLRTPRDTWVRLEAQIVIDGEKPADIELVAAKINEDFLSYLRTVSLYQIEGASGFLHIRDDLLDVARVRSQNAVSDLVITALVVE